ncbi:MULTISPECIES: carbohydrate ABC transporter permease [unclassified Paenibacillus]|jgi:putative aldouronate transport system permease protein|uniref:carbohydrate ABC transporter permease n=2 Tax=Paenibacillus TaxID=44249 RepID=UPI0006950CB1|nr:carbohydrate ABC transporter permease [Paenibacillus sp. FSL P4-0081]
MMRTKISLFDICNNIFLLLIALVCTYPFLYIFFLSISDGRSIASGDVVFFPKNPNFEAYQYILTNSSLGIFRGLLNSGIYTAIGTVVALMLTYMTAYVLSRKQIKGRFLIMSLFVFTWVFEAGIIPAYIVLNKLGFVDNWLVMIIPNAINVQFLIITKTFLDGLPTELEEAAKIDGANDFQVMSRVFLPISKPILATIGVFYAVFIWNQYLMPLIYLQNPNLQTIQVMLKRLVISSGDSNTAFRTIIQDGIMLNPGNLKAAAIFVAMVPIVLIYPFVQKYFKKGILLGSVK